MAPTKSCQDEYKYSKLNAITTPAPKLNIYGIVKEVVKEFTALSSGKKYHSIVTLFDETCPAFRVSFFLDEAIPIEEGSIVRIHRMKVETFNDTVDGRVFRATDVVLFSMNPSNKPEYYTCAKSFQYTTEDKKRILELSKCYKSFQSLSFDMSQSGRVHFGIGGFSMKLPEEVIPKPTESEEKNINGRTILCGKDAVAQEICESSSPVQEDVFKRKRSDTVEQLLNHSKHENHNLTNEKVNGNHEGMESNGEKASTRKMERVLRKTKRLPQKVRNPFYKCDSGQKEQKDLDETMAFSVTDCFRREVASSPYAESCLKTDKCKGFDDPIESKQMQHIDNNFKQVETSPPMANSQIIFIKEGNNKSSECLDSCHVTTGFESVEGSETCRKTVSHDLKVSSTWLTSVSPKTEDRRHRKYKTKTVLVPLLTKNAVFEDKISDDPLKGEAESGVHPLSVTSSSKYSDVECPDILKSNVLHTTLSSCSDDDEIHSNSTVSLPECPGVVCANTCASSDPVILSESDSRLINYDDVLFKEMEIDQASYECGNDVKLSHFSYLPFSGNIHVSSVDLKQLSNFTWPVHQVKVQLLDLKPSIEVLQNSGPKDLISGFCSSCALHFRYSHLIWDTNCESRGTKRPICPNCLRDGKPRNISLNFRFKLLVKDAWGTTLTLMTSKARASEFLGVSLRLYQENAECRQELYKQLQQLMISAYFFKIRLQQTNTQVDVQYHIYDTTIKQLLESCD